LHLGGAALLGVGVQQLLVRERQRDSEQALHDALVDLPREVDALLQLAALLVVGGDLAGDGGHRDGLAERPQQVSLVLVHLRQVGLALGEHHPDVAPGGGHRRAEDAHALQQLAHGGRHLEVGGSHHFEDLVLGERLARDGDGVDRHEQVGERLQLDAVRTDGTHAPAHAVVADEHGALHRREPADGLAQAAEEGVWG
jgi:hypothetical protein